MPPISWSDRPLTSVDAGTGFTAIPDAVAEIDPDSDYGAIMAQLSTGA